MFRLFSVNLDLAPTPGILEGKVGEATTGKVCVPQEGAKLVILEPDLDMILKIKHLCKTRYQWLTTGTARMFTYSIEVITFHRFRTHPSNIVGLDETKTRKKKGPALLIVWEACVEGVLNSLCSFISVYHTVVCHRMYSICMWTKGFRLSFQILQGNEWDLTWRAIVGYRNKQQENAGGVLFSLF